MSSREDCAKGIGPATAAAVAAPFSPPPQPPPQPPTRDVSASQDPSTLALSKNALKRLRRKQEWENSREDRLCRRREKRRERKSRRREENAALLAAGADPAELLAKTKQPPGKRVPVTLVLDCGFESYMSAKEGVSLASQVTRCYADNRSAKFKVHLWISSWGGSLKDRFEGPMASQHLHWKGVRFEAGDFLEAACKAREAMRHKRSSSRIEISRDDGEDDDDDDEDDDGQDSDGKDEGDVMPDSLRAPSAGAASRWEKDSKAPFPLAEPMPALDERYKDVVYLTSESPYTLDRLEPYTAYIIGGLVDKNREKGLCYKRAVQRGIRTAKLPIGRYMMMRSRQILATNHVVEIMLRWLECQDWGEAFTQVIPKRKGGQLRLNPNDDLAVEQNSRSEDKNEHVTTHLEDKGREHDA